MNMTQLANAFLLLTSAIYLLACGGGGGSEQPPPIPVPPEVSISDAAANEGNSGVSTLSFNVSLSAAQSTDVTLDYASANGGATAGEDYVAANASLIVPAGQTMATIDVTINGDTEVESDENFSLTLSNLSTNATFGDSTATGTILNDDINIPPIDSASILNDTGVTACGNATANNLPCNDQAEGTDQFPAQDGESGRDITHNDDSDGRAGFAFTKLDNSGTPLADQGVSYTTMPWACVQDEVSGLMWEVKTDDDGLHDKDWRYSWYISKDGLGVYGDGTPNSGSCVDSENCDTEKYVAAVNSAGLCGANDWRMPTRSELLSLVDYGAIGSIVLDMNYFPNATGAIYWTGMMDQMDDAWTVRFDDGESSPRIRSNSYSVRLVRGGYIQ